MSELKIEYLPKYKYDDYKQWEGKWELIHGIPYAMSPAPRIEHQLVSGKINFQLLTLLKNCKKFKALLPVDWRVNMEEEDDIILQPDNLVICSDVKGNYITEAPVLIFEIISPSSALKDRFTKYQIYESQKVKYYVIVEPESKIAEVFELKDNNYIKIEETINDTIKFELDEDCSVNFNFSEIWI